MGPEESPCRSSPIWASDIAMAFDECVENPAQYEYAKAICGADRSAGCQRCKAEHDRLNSLPDTVNPHQMLFGINQGATFADLRIWHMQEIAKIDCDGYAIGGLAVGEPTEVMYEIIEAVEPYMPKDKPRYLMGVGTPSNIIEARGPGRGLLRLRHARPQRPPRQALYLAGHREHHEREVHSWMTGPSSRELRLPGVPPLFSRAYLRHLFKADEVLALRLAVLHNLWFYNELMAKIREALDNGTFADFREKYSGNLEKRALIWNGFACCGR